MVEELVADISVAGANGADTTTAEGMTSRGVELMEVTVI
jgi:hypothetical protein